MVCALLVCNLVVSTLFFSLKVSMGLFLLAMMLHKFISPNVPFVHTCYTLLEGLSSELVAALLAGLAIAGLGTYRYLRERFDAKLRAIELSRTYERRLSLESIHNQVNWHRLDPTHGSAMLQEISKMLETPCHYLYTHGQEKLGANINGFMKKLREFSSLLLQRSKEERSLKLNKNAIRPIYIASTIDKAYNRPVA